MTQNIKATFKKTDEAKTNLNCAHRLIKSNAITPEKKLVEKAPYGGIPFFLPIEDAYKVLEFSGKCCANSFFKENKKHLPMPEKKLLELSPYTKDEDMNLLKGKFIMAPFLLDVMKCNKMQMLCVDEETAYYAYMLIRARTQVTLTKKFMEYLPDGEAQLFHANRCCLLLYARTQGSLTRQFWDDLPSNFGQLLKLKKTITRKKALYDMELYIGMNRDTSANIVLFAPDIETAKKIVKGHNENNEVEGGPAYLGFGVHEVNGGVIEKIRSIERIYI